MILKFQHGGTRINNESDNPSGQNVDVAVHKSILNRSWIKPAVILFSSLEIMDALITYWAVNRGLVSEGNHLIAQMAGSWNFVLLKVIGAFLSGLILLKLHEHFPRATLAAAVTIALLYSGVLVWNSNMIIHALILR
jgi:hypothetical protein